MRLELTIPGDWLPDGDGWRVGDVAVSVSRLEPEPPVPTAATAARAIERHRARPGDVAIERSARFPTERGWPAIAFYCTLRSGGARFAVRYSMLEYQAVACADVGDRRALEAVSARLAAVFATARPRWSGVASLAEVFAGFAHP